MFLNVNLEYTPLEKLVLNGQFSLRNLALHFIFVPGKILHILHFEIWNFQNLNLLKFIPHNQSEDNGKPNKSRT